MEDDFKELVSKRCEKALVECDEYIEKEYSGIADQEELRIMSETLCYQKGFFDCLAIIKYSQKI